MKISSVKDEKYIKRFKEVIRNGKINDGFFKDGGGVESAGDKS